MGLGFRFTFFCEKVVQHQTYPKRLDNLKDSNWLKHQLITATLKRSKCYWFRQYAKPIQRDQIVSKIVTGLDRAPNLSKETR